MSQTDLEFAYLSHLELFLLSNKCMFDFDHFTSLLKHIKNGPILAEISRNWMDGTVPLVDGWPK